MPPAQQRQAYCMMLFCPEMCQPHCVQYMYMHHGLTFVFLCVPVLSADNARCQFVILCDMAFLWRCFLAIMLIVHIFQATGFIAGILLILFHAYNAMQKVEHS